MHLQINGRSLFIQMGAKFKHTNTSICLLKIRNLERCIVYLTFTNLESLKQEKGILTI